MSAIKVEATLKIILFSSYLRYHSHVHCAHMKFITLKSYFFLFFTAAMFFTIATIFLYHVCLEISLEIENCYENLSWMSVKLQQLYSKCV